ncbi:MAG: SCP2 sterol-binding domain-containing protein [Acidobacteria bacterium]|nr:SCP2 sterol-binding domain-containing protein [Acidobacteriota bacterium]
MAELFSDPWAVAWGEELRRSEAYRQAARNWEGPVVFELSGTECRSVYLDLWRGECRIARIAEDGDIESARFVLSADLATWISVLEGNLSPLPAVMRGKLQLKKGKLSALLPFTAAARELVVAATNVSTEFPGAPSAVPGGSRG